MSSLTSSRAMSSAELEQVGPVRFRSHCWFPLLVLDDDVEQGVAATGLFELESWLGTAVTGHPPSRAGGDFAVDDEVSPVIEDLCALGDRTLLDRPPSHIEPLLVT